MLLQVDLNEDMTNTKVDNLMVVLIQGSCRPVTLQACYFDILTAFEGKFWLKLPNLGNFSQNSFLSTKTPPPYSFLMTKTPPPYSFLTTKEVFGPLRSQIR